MEVERLKRERNVVIFGLRESASEEIYSLVMETLTTSLKIPLREDELDLVRRLGPRTGQERPRPVLVKLTTQRKKELILKEKRRLKNSQLYIAEDLPKEVVTVRKSLGPRLAEARSKGLRAFIRYDKLIIKKPEPVSLPAQKPQLSVTLPGPSRARTPINSPQGSPVESVPNPGHLHGPVEETTAVDPVPSPPKTRYRKEAKKK